MHIDLDMLFDGDRSVLFKLNPGDAETPANISVATLKEMALAINCQQRAHPGFAQEIRGG